MNLSESHKVIWRIALQPGLFLVTTSLGVMLLSGILDPVQAISLLQENPQLITLNICSADVETLIPLLLRDLPSYANRASQRAQPLERKPDISSDVIVAGRPEFAPLSLGPGQYTPLNPSAELELKQVFITTLERQYTDGQPIELQQYHWIFLTQTDLGWQLAMMFSRTSTYPALHPATPPRDSTDGILGQAVRTWLRDCRAGTVRPL